jgi:hypothetical protein
MTVRRWSFNALYFDVKNILYFSFFLGFIVPNAKEENIIMITFSQNVVETADWNYVGKLILFATQCSIVIYVSSLAVLWLEFLNISLRSLIKEKENRKRETTSCFY